MSTIYMESTTLDLDDLTPAQQALVDNLKEHTAAELVDFDVDKTLATMADNPFIYLSPTLGGGEGPEGVHAFYSKVLTHLPEDFDRQAVSVTVGSNRIVIEEVLSFTHNVPMEWMLPGVAPTGRRVELPLVVVCTFKNGKLESERAYWDNASMLSQLGLLEAEGLPIKTSETVAKLLQLANRP